MTVTKVSDFRANQKEYLKRAYEGETVLISRPKSENVVMVSEEDFRRMSCALRVMEYCRRISNSNHSEPTIMEINMVYNNMLEQPDSILKPRKEEEFMERIERSLRQIDAGDTEDALEAGNEVYMEIMNEEVLG